MILTEEQEQRTVPFRQQFIGVFPPIESKNFDDHWLLSDRTKMSTTEGDNTESSPTNPSNPAGNSDEVAASSERAGPSGD